MQVIASGKTAKSGPGSCQIDFPDTVSFKHPPVVVISPRWTGQVSNIETIIAINSDGFQTQSGNGGTNYVIEWIAIGEGSSSE